MNTSDLGPRSAQRVFAAWLAVAAARISPLSVTYKLSMKQTIPTVVFHGSSSLLLRLKALLVTKPVLIIKGVKSKLSSHRLRVAHNIYLLLERRHCGHLARTSPIKGRFVCVSERDVDLLCYFCSPGGCFTSLL